MEHLTITPSKARIRVSEKATQQGGGFESGTTPYDSSHQAVNETEAVVTGEGMEETLVGESSLGESSSEAETGEEEPGEVQGDPDDFFAGLS